MRDCVECPRCVDSFDAVMAHLSSVEVNAGGRVITIEGRHGPVQSIAPPAGRGTQITIRCFCEQGHGFRIVYSFHKGCIHAEIEDDPSLDHEVPDCPPEMWRS